MYFWGVLAIFQILFFPGLIFRSLYKPKGGFFFQLSVVAATSMLANFLLFYPLASFHLYTKTVVLVVIGLELAALIWLYRGIFRTRLDDVSENIRQWASRVVENVLEMFKGEKYSPTLRVLRGIFLLGFLGLALSLLFWFFRRLTNNFGSVFNTWDAVVSWNAWAQAWAQGIIPRVHFTYPQLLPINWSLTYLLTGNYEICLFAKAIMPLFALLTVLTIFELAYEKKEYAYLIAVAVVYLLYKKFLGEYIADGYADVPVAFMAWIALIPYLRNDDLLQDKKEFILSMILAAAAGVTKQVGLYILALIPLIAFLQTKHKSKKLAGYCLIVLGLAVVLVLPWYLPRLISVLQGNIDIGLSAYVSHSSNVFDTTSLVKKTGLAFLGLGKYVILYALLLPAIFMLRKKYWPLIVFYLIPFSILWGMFISYDTRTLSMTFPLLAVITGLVVAVCVEFCCRLFTKLKLGRLGAAFLVLLILLPVLYFGLRWNDEKLTALYEENQSEIFSAKINEQLYALDFSRGDCQSILTNYPVSFLPGMKERQINFYFTDFGMYEKYAADPTICYMLVPGSAALDTVKQDIAQKVENGTYQLLFTTDDWVPYQLIQIR